MGDSVRGGAAETECMQRRLVAALAAAVLFAIVLPVVDAQASGGRYVFVGGTPAERTTVTSALAASAFDWSLVPGTTTIRIARGVDSSAVPGEIRLDADLLDAGRFAWGVVQHEYAHEVDFFLLTDAMRSALDERLGTTAWWSPSVAHADLGGEEFATTLAWSYWPSHDNVMEPTGPRDEGGRVAPAAFRALVASLLPGATPVLMR